MTHALGVRGQTAKDLYRILLVTYHRRDTTSNDDETEDQAESFAAARKHLIDRCFFPAIEVARVGDGWSVAPKLDRPTAVKGLNIIDALPAVRFVAWNPKKGAAETKTCKTRVSRMHLDADLSSYGYAPLHPVRGVDIADTIGDPTAYDGQAVPALVGCDPAFRYRPPGERDAGGHLDGFFPGLQLGVVTLLVGAKAFVQRGSAEPPQVFLVGPSGAGKSTHVKFAAELTGDAAPEVSADQPADRTRRAVIDMWRGDGLTPSWTSSANRPRVTTRTRRRRRGGCYTGSRPTPSTPASPRHRRRRAARRAGDRRYHRPRRCAGQ